MATAVTPVAMSVSVFEGVPVNPELENSKEKKEIDDIWRQVQDRVIQIAGGDPRKIERTMDIDGVLKYIENSKDLEKKSADKYGWVKTTFQQTLQCIQTVGGIVADGASYVRQISQILNLRWREAVLMCHRCSVQPSRVIMPSHL